MANRLGLVVVLFAEIAIGAAMGELPKGRAAAPPASLDDEAVDTLIKDFMSDDDERVGRATLTFHAIHDKLAARLVEIIADQERPKPSELHIFVEGKQVPVSEPVPRRTREALNLLHKYATPDALNILVAKVDNDIGLRFMTSYEPYANHMAARALDANDHNGTFAILRCLYDTRHFWEASNLKATEVSDEAYRFYASLFEKQYVGNVILGDVEGDVADIERMRERARQRDNMAAVARYDRLLDEFNALVKKTKKTGALKISFQGAGSVLRRS